jgi:lysyl endopeptidase
MRMRKLFTFITLFVALSMVTVFAASNVEKAVNLENAREVSMLKSPGEFNPTEYLEKQQNTHFWLKSEAAPLTPGSVLSIRVSNEEMSAVETQKCETCGDNTAGQPGKLAVGLVKNVNRKVSFHDFTPDMLGEYSGGALRAEMNGGYVWTLAVESSSATALRLHISDMNLPENASLFIYNDKNEAFGPYILKGPNMDGDLWTNTIAGPIAYLQLHVTGENALETLRSIEFNVSDVGHLGPKYLIPFLQKPYLPKEEISLTATLCSYNASCVEDASCYGTGQYAYINTHKYAVAYMEFVSGAYIYLCTGGLLNNTRNDLTPYFLTANHCISKRSQASSLECYFQYWTASCGGACYDPIPVCPRTIGSTIKSGSSKTGDYTLLLLSQPAPSGSVFLGWTSTAVANTNGAVLYRLSHPQGAPQSFSKHAVSTTAPVCRSWPRGKWIYSRDTIGATEPGSSGSPICNANGQVVGQLSGACGTNVNNVCDAVNNATVDGAFASYYSSVASFLSPI